MSQPPERPLALGELVAETVRLYGERIRAAFGLGAVFAGAFMLARLTHPVAEVLLISLAFTGTYGAAARVAAGDGFAEAWAQVGVRVPTLLVLTLVVALPFALAIGYLVLLVFAVAWLAFAGFSIPVAMLERDPGTRGWLARLGFALDRSLALARTEYLHAVGVVSALVIIYLLLGILLGQLLVGVADNNAAVATALVQLVLAPFFFLGLAVLYFEQRARALSSRREPT